MSFLQELENNKQRQSEIEEKTPKQLWESCFKYFKHLISILKKDQDKFAAKFNFVFLNVNVDTQITGPYEISRATVNNELTLTIKMLTIINKSITIKRKDQRSAELLQSKLQKDNILSLVKKDNNGQHFIEVSKNIPSTFQLTLKNNTDFYITYKNICSSATKTIKLATDEINEQNMDNIAKYILGQNSSLYTEAISEDDITLIRDKIALEKQKKAEREQVIQQRLKQQEEQEALRKANTLKEKSKKYMISQTEKVKNIVVKKIKELKSKI